MGRISIDNVRSGITLAQDAYTFRKQLLLHRGTVLTDKNIELMKAWGVSEIDTEGCGEPTLEEIEHRLTEHAELAAAAQALDHRFRDVRRDPLMKEILTIAKKQLLAERA